MTADDMVFTARRSAVVASMVAAAAALIPLSYMAGSSVPLGMDRWAASAAPGWGCSMAPAAAAMSALGYEYGTLPLSVVLPLWAALRRQWTCAGFSAFVLLGSLWINQALKYWFDRWRPTWMPCFPEPGSNSFPSGHAMASATLIAVVILMFPRFRRPIPAVILCALGIGIGASRVILGVHYPSDVLAGWCFGVAWACGCYLVASHYRGA